MLADTHITGSGADRLPAPAWELLRNADAILGLLLERAQHGALCVVEENDPTPERLGHGTKYLIAGHAVRRTDEAQRAVFGKQLEIAAESGKPIVIHTRAFLASMAANSPVGGQRLRRFCRASSLP